MKSYIVQPPEELNMDDAFTVCDDAARIFNENRATMPDTILLLPPGWKVTVVESDEPVVLDMTGAMA